MFKSENRSVDLGLVLIRMVTGILLVLHSWEMIARSDGVPNLLAGADLTSPLFIWWGENLLAENPAFFSGVIVWTEFLGGAALFLGALVRPMGLLLTAVMVCCAVSDEGLLRYAEILIAANTLGCAVSGAGCAFGLDAIFVQHFPRWVTWIGRGG
jgi:uncharacterized membrane protein YphA (DoxX/SURF4 family)